MGGGGGVRGVQHPTLDPEKKVSLLACLSERLVMYKNIPTLCLEN